MALDDYKVVIYRNQPSGWVAEIPSIESGYASRVRKDSRQHSQSPN
jgi:hypothetical protein